MNDFDDFLNQEAFGGDLDSSGAFTLGKEKALEKLTEMTLAAPTDWVLKIVQAAVCAGCHTLKFRIGRNIVQVDLHGTQLDLSPIRDGLLDPGYSPEPFYKELFVGLRSLLREAQFRLCSATGDWLAWQGKALHENLGNPISDHITLVVANAPVQRFRQAAAYSSSLKERAVYAPLELTLDGQQINPQKEFAASLPDFGTGYPIHTAPLLFARFHKDRHLYENDLLKSRGAPLKDPLRSLDYFLSSARLSPHSAGNCCLHLLAKYKDEPIRGGDSINKRELQGSPFDLRFTRFGVVCANRSSNFLVGGALQMPLDKARSDLSGLALELDPKAIQLVNIDPYLETLARAVNDHRSRLHLYQPDFGRFGAGFAMAAGVAAGFVVTLGGGPLLALKLGSSLGTVSGSTMLTWGADNATHRDRIAMAVQDLKARWRGLAR